MCPTNSDVRSQDLPQLLPAAPPSLHLNPQTATGEAARGHSCKRQLGRRPIVVIAFGVPRLKLSLPAEAENHEDDSETDQADPDSTRPTLTQCSGQNRAGAHEAHANAYEGRRIEVPSFPRHLLSPVLSRY